MTEEKWKQIKNAVRDAADPLMIALLIGLDVQMSEAEQKQILMLGNITDSQNDFHGHLRKRISVLCPGHDDLHHGSCHITERGCCCYVCNRTYDVFDMVRLHENVSFQKAVMIVADFCGGWDRFLDTADVNNDTSASSRLISKDDMILLGIFNTPVYGLKAIVADFEAPPREPGVRQTWYPEDPENPNSDYIVLEECLMKSPLLELCINAPSEYNRLIRDKSEETLLDYRSRQKEAYTFSRSFVRELNAPIRRLEELYIEYGGSLQALDQQNNNTDNAHANIFESCRWEDTI